MLELQRHALCVEYDGTDFVGWQAQTGLRSVQAAVEAEASAIADEPLTVVAAGRTDAGVHARGQVVHFDTARERPLKAWVLGVNAPRVATTATWSANGARDRPCSATTWLGAARVSMSGA